MLYKEALPKDFITAEEFASDLLGFEEYEEGEEEGDLADGAGAGAGMDNTKESGMGMGVNEVIPEEDGF